MSLTFHLADNIEQRLQEESARLDESVDSILHRILDSVLPVKGDTKVSSHSIVKPFDLQVYDRWAGMTPTEILERLDVEEYEEQRERADTNLLIYAYDKSSVFHPRAKAYLEDSLNEEVA